MVIGGQMAKRSKEELMNEYRNKCAILGQATYKVYALEAELEATKKEISQLKRDLKYLNAEASRNEEPEAPAAAEEVKGEANEPAV